MNTRKNASPGKIRHMVHVPGTTLSYPETLILGAADSSDAASGPHVTVSAGVHCREYVGIEALNRLAAELDPEQIHGALRLIHALNYRGLIARSADVFPEDGLNLNRVFPGNPAGSSTERLAAFLEREVISWSDAIIDLHSGGFCEELTPHTYFHGVCSEEINLRSQEIAQHSSASYAYRSSSRNGFYSHAGQCGVPAIILERGGCGVWRESEVLEDMEDVRNMLRFLGVLADGVAPVRHEPCIMTAGRFEDAPASGFWYPAFHAGDQVCRGQVLGQIRDAFGQVLHTCTAELDGVILYQTASLGIEAGTPMVAYGAN